jgi:hypothetical protein
MDLIASTLSISLGCFSQIPGLRSKSRKTKSTVHLAGKEARIPAAKRIAAQLAERARKSPELYIQPPTPHYDDAPHADADDDEALGLDDDLGDSSSTEPGSDDEEEHGIWEERDKERKQRRREKEERSWEEEIREEREHVEAEEHREEAERRHQVELRLQEELRQEKERRRQEELRKEDKRRDGEQGTDQPSTLPRVTLKVSQKKTIRSSKKRPVCPLIGLNFLLTNLSIGPDSFRCDSA